MKKGIIIVIALLSICIFVLGFNYKSGEQPNTYYQVYLDNEILGTIKSKKDLEKYIDKKGEYYKRKYNVKTIYAPNGFQVKKITTFNGELTNVEKIYSEIESRKPFTVSGYQIKIKDKKNTKTIYVLKESVYRTALEEMVKTFVGKDNYQAYIDDTQSKIETTGEIIKSISINEDQTIKSVQIPVDEKIYTNSEELSKFLLFGPNNKQKKYKVGTGDTIETVAFNNKISVEEFLISNPNFTSTNNLLYPGQEVIIGITDPQLKVTVVKHTVSDIVSKYRIEEEYDPNRLIGDDEIVRKGENGLERITQDVTVVNGNIFSVKPISKQELKPTINQIIVRGEKSVPSIGSTSNWSWPTTSGWIITSNYGYRINPFSGRRELHPALDIAGPGHGSPIYASNNGTIEEAGWHYSYGNYIIINHHNGYYSLYAHMSRLVTTAIGQTIGRGQHIGYMGMTGDATGPHLHYEIWVGKPWSGGYQINPWSMHQ